MRNPQLTKWMILLVNCPNCNALYQIKAIDRRVTCRACRGPLPAREGKFVLKYFLLRKAIRSKKWQRQTRPVAPTERQPHPGEIE